MTWSHVSYDALGWPGLVHMVMLPEIPGVATEQALMHKYFSNLLCHVANVPLARASDMAKYRVTVRSD